MPELLSTSLFASVTDEEKKKQKLMSKASSKTLVL